MGSDGLLPQLPQLMVKDNLDIMLDLAAAVQGFSKVLQSHFICGLMILKIESLTLYNSPKTFQPGCERQAV